MEFILESTKSLSVLDEYVFLPTFLGIVPLNDRYIENKILLTMKVQNASN